MKTTHLVLFALSLPLTLRADSLPPVTLEEDTIEGLAISSNPVVPRIVANPVTATARIAVDPTRTRTIATFFPGHLDRDLVQTGEQVEAGQPLAYLKSREVAAALATWLEAERKYESASVRYEREKSLRPQKLTTEDEYLAAKAVYQEALATRTGALQTALLARSRDELLALGEADGTSDLTSLPLVSPIDGTLLRKKAYAGDAVEMNSELFEVADLDRLLLEIKVPLKAASFLKVGDSLEFHTVVGEEENETARVSRIDPVVDETTLAVLVYAHVDNSERRWLVGTPVNVSLLDATAGKVTAVPSNALVTIAGSPHLFLDQGDGLYQPLAITTGQASQAFTEITSELPDGARVVDSGASLLLAAWEDRTAE